MVGPSLSSCRQLLYSGGIFSCYINYVHEREEEIEFPESLTYFVIVVSPGIPRSDLLAPCYYGLAQYEYMTLPIHIRMTKIPIFNFLVVSVLVLLNGWEMWTPVADLQTVSCIK